MKASPLGQRRTGLALNDTRIGAPLAAGIESLTCLYHRDLPQAIHELGGWRNRDADDAAAQRFAEYWNDTFPYPRHFALYPPQLADAIEPYVRPGDLAQIARPVDWLGLNHYSPHHIKADANSIDASFGAPPDDVPRTAIRCGTQAADDEPRAGNREAAASAVHGP